VKITFLCGSGERLGEDLKLRNFEEELVGTFFEYKKIILNVSEYVHEPKPFRAYLRCDAMRCDATMRVPIIAFRPRGL
jgi:hypothetical protein